MKNTGAICGGVISESQHRKNMKIDIWLDTMAYVMPDEQFKEYQDALKDGRKFMLEYADKLFKKYARSQI